MITPRQEPPTRLTREGEEMMTVTQSVPGLLSGRQARWTVDTDNLETCFSVGLTKVATVEGRFGKAEGTIVLDDGAPHWSRVDLSIEAYSIDTRSPVRDYHLRTRSPRRRAVPTHRRRELTRRAARRYDLLGDGGAHHPRRHP